MLVCIGTNKVSYMSSCNPKPTSSSTAIIKKKKHCFFYLVTYILFLPWRYCWSLHWSTILYIFAFLNIFLFCLQLVRENSSKRVELKCSVPWALTLLCVENFGYFRFVASEHLFLVSPCFTEFCCNSGGLAVRGIYFVWYFNSNEGLKIRTSPL